MKGIRYNLKTEWRVQKRPHKMTESETDRQIDRQTEECVDMTHNKKLTTLPGFKIQKC
jgi:hypothetical protein